MLGVCHVVACVTLARFGVADLRCNKKKNSGGFFGSLKPENRTMAGKSKLKAFRNIPFLLFEVLDRCCERLLHSVAKKRPRSVRRCKVFHI